MIVKSVLIIAVTSLLTMIVILYFIIDSNTGVSLDFHVFSLIAAVLLPLTVFGVVTIWCITGCDNQNMLIACQPLNREFSRKCSCGWLNAKSVLVIVYLLTLIVILYFLLGSDTGVHFDSYLQVVALLLPLTAFALITILCVTGCDNRTARTPLHRERSLGLLPTRALTAEIIVNIEDAVVLLPEHTAHSDDHNSSAHESGGGSQNNHRLSQENNGYGGSPPSYNQLLSDEIATVEEKPPDYVEAISFIN